MPTLQLGIAIWAEHASSGIKGADGNLHEVFNWAKGEDKNITRLVALFLEIRLSCDDLLKVEYAI